MDSARARELLARLLAELHGVSDDSSARAFALHELNSCMRSCIGPEAAGVPPCTPLGLDEEPDQCRHAVSVAALWLDAGAVLAGQAALEAAACKILAGHPSASCMANAGMALVSHASSALQRLVYGLEAGVLQPGDDAPAAAAHVAGDCSNDRMTPGPAASTDGAGARRTVSQLRSQLAEQLTSPALAVAVSDVVRAFHMATPPMMPMPMPLPVSGPHSAAGLAAASALRCRSCGGDMAAPGSSSGGASSASCSPCSCSSSASPTSPCSPRSTSPRASLEAVRVESPSGGETEGCSTSSTSSGNCSEGRNGDSVGGGGKVSSSAAALLGRARRACSGHACVAAVLGLASGAGDASGMQEAGSSSSDASAALHPPGGLVATATASASLLSTPHGACVLGRASRYLYLLLWCAHDSAGATAESPPDAATAPAASRGVLLRLVAALEESQLVEALCAAFLDTPAPAPPQPLPSLQQWQQPQPAPPHTPVAWSVAVPQTADGSTAANSCSGGARGRALTQKELRKQQKQHQAQPPKGKAREPKAHVPIAIAIRETQHPGGTETPGSTCAWGAELAEDYGSGAEPHNALLCSLRHGLNSLAHATSLLATLASSLNASANERSAGGIGDAGRCMGASCGCGEASADQLYQQAAEVATPAPMALRAGRLLLVPSAQRLQLSLLRHLSKSAGRLAADTAADKVAPRCRSLLDAVYPGLPHAPPVPPPRAQAPPGSRSHRTAAPAQPASESGQLLGSQRMGRAMGSQRAPDAEVAGEMAARAARDLALLPQLQPALLGWATLERLGLGGELEAAVADVYEQKEPRDTFHAPGARGIGTTSSTTNISMLGPPEGGQGHRDWPVPGDEAWGLAAPPGASSSFRSSEKPLGSSSGGAGTSEVRCEHLEATAAAAQALCRLLRGDCGPPPSPVLLKHVAPVELVSDILQGAVRRLCGHSPYTTAEQQRCLPRRPLPLYGHGSIVSISSRCSCNTSSASVMEGAGVDRSCALPAAWEALAWAAAVQAAEAEVELATGGRDAGPAAFAGAQPAALARLTQTMELCAALARSATAGGGPGFACGGGCAMPSAAAQEAGWGPARQVDCELATRLSQARWAATLNVCMRLASTAVPQEESEQPSARVGQEAPLGQRLRDLAIELVAASPTAAMWAPQPHRCGAGAGEAVAGVEVQASDLSALLLTLGKLAAAAGRQVSALAGPAAATASPMHAERTGVGVKGLAKVNVQHFAAACERADRLLSACDAAASAGTAALKASNGGALTLAPLRGNGSGNSTKGPARGSTAAGLMAPQLELLRGAVAACLRCGCGAAAHRLQASHALMLHHSHHSPAAAEAEQGTKVADVAAAHATVWCRWLALPLASWLPSRQDLMPARPLELLTACRDVLIAIPRPHGSFPEVEDGGSCVARSGDGLAATAGAAVYKAVRVLAEHSDLGEEVRCAWLDTAPAKCGAVAPATPLAGLLEALGVPQEQAAEEDGSPQVCAIHMPSAVAPVAPASCAAAPAATAAAAPEVDMLLRQARRLTQLLRATSASTAASAATSLEVGGRSHLGPLPPPAARQSDPTQAPVPATVDNAMDGERERDAQVRAAGPAGSTYDASLLDSCARYYAAHAAALARARDVSGR